jgi:hypothetical protein
MSKIRVLSTKEAADYIASKTKKSMSQRQVQREIAAGHLEAELRGNCYFIRMDVLKKYKRRKTSWRWFADE